MDTDASFFVCRPARRRFCREQVAYEKNTRELNEFSHALNCATDWKCRWKAKQYQSKEPQRSSNSKGNGLGSHFVPGAVPAKQPKTNGCTSVINYSGGVVHQRAPTTKK